MQVKVFSEQLHGLLEVKVNQFLKSNIEINSGFGPEKREPRIKHITQSSDSKGNTIVCIFYE